MFLLEMDGLMDTQKMDNPFNTNFCNDLKKFIIEIKNALYNLQGKYQRYCKTLILIFLTF